MEKGSVAIGTPKSQDSYRTIPIPHSVRYCARLLRAVDTKFIWERGKMDLPCNPSYFRKKFKEEIASVEGVRVLTPHSCRHTYVSQMQALGVDLATIQSLVGHADVDMTKHYLHVQDPVRQSAIAKFEDAFFEKPQEVHRNISESKILRNLKNCPLWQKLSSVRKRRKTSTVYMTTSRQISPTVPAGWPATV